MNGPAVHYKIAMQYLSDADDATSADSEIRLVGKAGVHALLAVSFYLEQLVTFAAEIRDALGQGG